MANSDKTIVTNVKALIKKYGRQGFEAMHQRIEALIAADKARGLTTILVALDDKEQMKEFSTPPVTRGSDPAQNKRAMDAVYRALAPDYLVILGSKDIIPHQDLENPIYDPKSEDLDKCAYGDLPYACEAPYSRKPHDFLGPTRVVGRIPDITIC